MPEDDRDISTLRDRLLHGKVTIKYSTPSLAPPGSHRRSDAAGRQRLPTEIGVWRPRGREERGTHRGRQQRVLQAPPIMQSPCRR